MPETAYNLLEEPLIGVQRTDGSRAEVSLPGALAGLADRSVAEFTAIQPHQQHAWHAFLTQLAAIATHRADGVVTSCDTTGWRRRLRALSGDGDDAWCLLVSDPQRPGFMQPPQAGRAGEALKNSSPYPDQLDLLVTAKNHDVKRQRIGHPRPEHWIYALVSLQTMEGYSGRGNYGISRMNGGLSNRPCFTLAADSKWPTRFVRDAQVWLERRGHLASTYGYPVQGGHALLWIVPWDGEESLPQQSCDPAYIEICRLVRLARRPGSREHLEARFGASKTARIDSAEGGLTGDIWTPIARKDGKALTASRSTLTYQKLNDLLVGEDFERCAALELRPEDAPAPVFVGRTLIRGQGVSDGLHERVLPIPPKARGFFGSVEGRARLGSLARERVDAVQRTRSSLLRVALLALAQAGADKLTFDDRRTDSWLRGFDSEVDAIFFEYLFAGLDLDPAEAKLHWERQVVAMARATLETAEQSVPLPSTRRYRALAAARRYFEGGARKHFPDLFSDAT